MLKRRTVAGSYMMLLTLYWVFFMSYVIGMNPAVYLRAIASVLITVQFAFLAILAVDDSYFLQLGILLSVEIPLFMFTLNAPPVEHVGIAPLNLSYVWLGKMFVILIAPYLMLTKCLRFVRRWTSIS